MAIYDAGGVRTQYLLSCEAFQAASERLEAAYAEARASTRRALSNERRIAALRRVLSSDRYNAAQKREAQQQLEALCPPISPSS